MQPRRVWELVNLPLLGVRLLTDPVVDLSIMVLTHPKWLEVLASGARFITLPVMSLIYHILVAVRGEENASQLIEAAESKVHQY